MTPEVESDARAAVRESPFFRSTLYLGFALTGIGSALPGVLLPVLIASWHLTDNRAGVLFLVIWASSSVGALLLRGSLRFCTAAGSAGTACGALGLAWAGQERAIVFAAIYGGGLGAAMTAVSLWRQRTHPDASGRELIRLNLMWALGAFVCPALLVQAVRTGRPAQALIALALAFAGFALWSVLQGRADRALRHHTGLSRSAWHTLRSVPFGLLLLTALCPGVEAAAGAWLTTYAQRETHRIGLTLAAPTALWAGLLLSRLYGSVMAEERLQAGILPALLLASVAGLLLIAFPYGPALLLGALLLGFSLGPIYPVLLARVLVHGEVGIVFVMAGVAAAVLPWLTGLVSTQNASLRAGFLVPAGATWLMAALAVFLRPAASEVL